MRISLIALSILLLTPVVSVAQDKPKAPSYSLPDNATFTAREVKISRKGDGSQTAVKQGVSDAERAKAEPDFEIAGTLNIPKEDAHGKGPYPALFMVSGSGPQDRNGFQGPVDIGTWEILDAVANAGFVVLRVDDRGMGGTPVGFKGTDPHELGYKALCGDARACINFLRVQPEVDAKRVFIAGHSEGGVTAPLLAAEKDLGIAGVLCLAGIGRNLYDLTIDQTEAAMKSLPALTRATNMKVQREFQDAVKENREPDWNTAGAAGAAALKDVWKTQIVPLKKWWHEHFNTDLAAIHKSLTCPLFVANGSADFQVSPEKDARKIAANLVAGKCTDVTLRIYDDLDHLFKPCGGRTSEMKMYFEKRAVNAAFIQDVVRWLEQHA